MTSHLRQNCRWVAITPWNCCDVYVWACYRPFAFMNVCRLKREVASGLLLTSRHSGSWQLWYYMSQCCRNDADLVPKKICTSRRFVFNSLALVVCTNSSSTNVHGSKNYCVKCSSVIRTSLSSVIRSSLSNSPYVNALLNGLKPVLPQFLFSYHTRSAQRARDDLVYLITQGDKS
jgi:hypothetical protein